MSHTACRVQSPCASLTLEVLRLLMIDEDFEVIEIPLAVVAPGPSKGLFNIRVLALCLAHGWSTKQSTSRRLYRIIL